MGSLRKQAEKYCFLFASPSNSHVVQEDTVSTISKKPQQIWSLL